MDETEVTIASMWIFKPPPLNHPVEDGVVKVMEISGFFWRKLWRDMIRLCSTHGKFFVTDPKYDYYR